MATHMSLEIGPVPRGEWTTLTSPGSRNVDGKILLILDNLTVALMRLDKCGEVPERTAPYPTDVVCLEGGGFTEVDGEEGEITAGFRVRWPANRARRLWTDTETMIVLVVEHFRPE